MSTHSDQPRASDDAPIAYSKTAKPDGALVEEAVTIDRPASELYQFWRTQTQLAEVMENVVSIVPEGSDRFRWTVKAPGGKEVSWVAAITNDIPDRELTWQSEDGGDIDNSGRIRFEDAGDRGTVVRATIAYDPPAGIVGQIVAKLFQREPRIQARRDLHRFKQLMETGEITTSARNQRQRENRNEDQTVTRQLEETGA
ncbi:MAG: SRPBCC family protein [Sphingomonadales bacterium]|nr:MAG: SRPBCC family protein [Sphingomonadales bacterium]